ncbi:MAG: glycosyltransferase [Holosporaceae bacterium]|nr:glycosyltransferase [Holosporaceae bacterium]
MEKVKLLFCHDRIIMGGVEKAFQEIATGLLKTNHYDIAVWCKTRITDPYFLDFFKSNGIIVYEHLYDEQKNAGFGRNVLRFFRRFSNRYLNNKLFLSYAEKADIIIDFKNGCMQNRIKKIKNKPKIVWLHCSFKFLTQDVKVDYSIYDEIICISNKLRVDMTEYLPELKNKFKTIYIPLYVEKIKSSASSDAKKHSLKTDAELLKNDYFIVVSRLSNDKDLDTVIEAYRQFINETSSLTKLYFVGEGPDQQRLESIVMYHKLEERIFFLQKINEPYVLIKNAKASILSSREEGSPLVIVESMILKTIAVSSDCPTAPRELLNNGKCGVLFEPGNVRELKNIMIKIDARTMVADQFSKNIDEWIGRFDSDTVLGQIDNLLKYHYNLSRSARP